MRRFILTILLTAISCVTFATGSDSLYFPDGMKWSYLVMQSLQTPDDYMYWEEDIHGDTTINGVVYRNIGSSYYRYVREEGGRVYMPNPQPYPEPTDPAELLLFDFNMNVGDSIQATCYGTGFEKWQKVVAVDTVELLNHVKARRLLFDDGDVDIEFICSPYTKLFKRTHGAFPEPTSYYYYKDLCCSVGDELLYEFTPQGCSFVDEQPTDTTENNEQAADTIPLYRYTSDDSGSSTVDPVDPNQVVVILQGDELTIREFMGEDITYNLNLKTQNNVPAQTNSSDSNYASQQANAPARNYRRPSASMLPSNLRKTVGTRCN